jgi:putative transposase
MRKPRQLREGARYHVSARANRKEMLLDSSAMKALFLEVVKRAKGKYNFRIENFCVMGNHFHFILQPLKGESLSAIMRWIMSVFAMSWNRIHKLTGHVWGERYFSRIIDSLREYLQIFHYIIENPVKACLVSDGRDFRFGGLAHIREGRTDIIDLVPLWLSLIVPACRQLCFKGPC